MDFKTTLTERKMDKENEDLRRQYDKQGLPYIVDKGQVIPVEIVKEGELPHKRTVKIRTNVTIGGEVVLTTTNLDEALKNFSEDVFAGVL